MPETPRDIIIELRRQWKPHKRYLADHPTAIRFHRACSWLDAAMQLNPDQDTDQIMILQWTAFNALYGVWNPERNEAFPDRQSWKDFVARIIRLDTAGTLAAILDRNRLRILTILANDYLDRIYWNHVDPSDPQPAAPRPSMNRRALPWFLEQRWTSIADAVLDRIYLLRCQLIHGAATYGSSLNRDPLQESNALLQELLPGFLQVWVNHGAREDWGLLCYPPLH